MTAVDARNGEFVAFDSAGDAGLVDAVGASCGALESGRWSPSGTVVSWMAALRSVANADLAAGYERVVIVAPVAKGLGHMTSPRWQAAALTAAGARVVLVQPDRAAMHAIGRNVLDLSRRAGAAMAVGAQAAAEAAAVGAVCRPMAGRRP